MRGWACDSVIAVFMVWGPLNGQTEASVQVCREAYTAEAFGVLQAVTKSLASLLASMGSGSVPSSPGPEASFEVKGPEGGTGLRDRDADISYPPPPPSTVSWPWRSDHRIERPVEMRREQVTDMIWDRRGRDKPGDSYSQGGRHWVSRSWPTFRNNLPSGGGKANTGGLWQECGGSRSGVKPCGVGGLRVSPGSG